MAGDNKKNLIVTLADKNYVEQAKQLFSSIYWNAGWKGDYMLLAQNIPEKELKWFKDKGIIITKVSPVKISNWKYEGEEYPITIFSKFYLFTPEFKKWKNVVFLDTDIIVRASLDELTKIKGFAAVKRFQEPLSKRFDFIKPNPPNKDIVKAYLEVKRDYNLKKAKFNSGVLVFSADIIKENTFFKLDKLLLKYKNFVFGDEPILNLFFCKKWINLPPAYNVYPYFLMRHYKIIPNKIKGVILHFASPTIEGKPWNIKNPFYKEWKNNLKKAEFINLKKPQNPIKKWSKQEIKHYSQYLFKERVKSLPLAIIYKIYLYVDRIIGLIGIFIKSISPKVYVMLKKYKFNLSTDV